MKNIRLWHKANKSLFGIKDIFCENNLERKNWIVRVYRGLYFLYIESISASLLIQFVDQERENYFKNNLNLTLTPGSKTSIPMRERKTLATLN